MVLGTDFAALAIFFAIAVFGADFEDLEDFLVPVVAAPVLAGVLAAPPVPVAAVPPPSPTTLTSGARPGDLTVRPI
jgi:hypothetical protein